MLVRCSVSLSGFVGIGSRIPVAGLEERIVEISCSRSIGVKLLR